jgi:AcrR family transcriptional regulator
MTPLAKPNGRVYRSQLRAEQAEDTRERILDATVRVAAKSPAGISVPDVAREAGVSVPTIYRHFRTKGELFAAVYPHLGRRAGFGVVAEPQSVEEFHEMVRTVFGGLDSLGEVARRAIASPAADEARRAQMPARLAMSRHFAETVAPNGAKADLDRIARVFVVLTMSSAMRVWRDHLGSSVDEAADDVEWMLRAAIQAATRRRDR